MNQQTTKKRGRPRKQNQQNQTTTTTTKEYSFKDEIEPEPDEKQKIELENLHKEAEQTSEPKKETRGRKKKEEQQKEEQAKMFGSTVSNFGTVSFGLLISRMYPEQPLNPVEEKSLNEAVEAVAVKYVGIVGEYQEETALVLCLAFIFLPRYIAQKEKKKTEKSETVTEIIPDV